jgi:hypothetical protein
LCVSARLARFWPSRLWPEAWHPAWRGLSAEGVEFLGAVVVAGEEGLGILSKIGDLWGGIHRIGPQISQIFTDF